jgi:hypothetical protein
MTKDEIIKGIAAYEREQKVLLRLLRKHGSFTETEFDLWFMGREQRRPKLRWPALIGDTFAFAISRDGWTIWAVMLSLLQVMVSLKIVETKTDAGKMIYFLPQIETC